MHDQAKQAASPEWLCRDGVGRGLVSGRTGEGSSRDNGYGISLRTCDPELPNHAHMNDVLRHHQAESRDVRFRSTTTGPPQLVSRGGPVLAVRGATPYIGTRLTAGVRNAHQRRTCLCTAAAQPLVAAALVRRDWLSPTGARRERAPDDRQCTGHVAPHPGRPQHPPVGCSCRCGPPPRGGPARRASRAGARQRGESGADVTCVARSHRSGPGRKPSRPGPTLPAWLP